MNEDPYEVRYLHQGTIEPRPLAVARDEALPVYVQAYSAKVAKKGENLQIFVDDKKVQDARLIDTSQLVLMGNVYVTTPCLHELMKRGVPITWHSYGGWFIGHTTGTGHKNVELRTDARRALRAANLQELLGMEGAAASRYFGVFGEMLKRDDDVRCMTFDFKQRNRRPPADPVNALLSYAYSLLVRHWSVTLSAVGFDPYRGFYHQPRYGRPALARYLLGDVPEYVEFTTR